MPDVPLSVAVRDPRLLGSTPWHPRQLDLLEAIERNPTTVVRAGRRGGKSRIAAAVAVHSLLLADRLDGYLPPHEPRLAIAVATSEEQARIVLDHAVALVTASPILRAEVATVTMSELTFRSGHVLRVVACNSRTLRGRGASVVVLDELAWFYGETDGPATAQRVWEALTPSVASFGHEGRVLAISTPGDSGGLFERLYLQAESGELPEAVAFSASTVELNPGVPDEFLSAQRLALGADSFAREYLAEFVAGGGRFFEPDELRAVTSNRREALPADGRQWVCAIDPSSGGGDPFACVMVGKDARPGFEGRLLVGHVESWRPRGPRRGLSRRTRTERDLWVDSVLDHVAEIALRFGAEVVSDQHVPGVVLDELRKRGVSHVRIVPWTATTRTEAFQTLRARIATERIELTADEQTIAELLRIRTRFRSGSSQVEVPRVGDSHGDRAIALAAAVHALDRHGVGGFMTFHAPTGGRIRTRRFLREEDDLALPFPQAEARGEHATERLAAMRKRAGVPQTTRLEPGLRE